MPSDTTPPPDDAPCTDIWTNQYGDTPFLPDRVTPETHASTKITPPPDGADPKSLSEVESDYIRDKTRYLDARNPDHLAYIADLILLEQSVLDEWNPITLLEGYFFISLRGTHAEDWDHIQRELAPDDYHQRIHRDGGRTQT